MDYKTTSQSTGVDDRIRVAKYDCGRTDIVIHQICHDQHTFGN